MTLSCYCLKESYFYPINMQVLRKTVLLAAAAVIISMQGTAQTVSQIDKGLVHYLGKINYWKSRQSAHAFDSLAYANDHLIDYMKKVFPWAPATLKGNFKLANAKGMHYVTSDDGNLRFYYWDMQMGTSIHFFADFAQYTVSDGAGFVDMIDPNVQGDPGGFYTSIITVQASGRPVYLVMSGSAGSEREESEQVTAFSVIDDKLVKVLLFHKRLKKFSHLEYDYDPRSIEKLKGKKPTIHLSPDKQFLYMPDVDDGGDYTGDFIVYKFNGEFYVFDKADEPATGK